MTTSPEDRKARRMRSAVIVLLLLGVAARVFAAWCYRNNTDPDSGIVSLMAKHMAEGQGFPIFFYGQAYMGSLEPAFSALLCKLFGVSGFMVCLGTAIIAMLLLPLIYIWANEAGGRIAGLAALAFCVLGPHVFFAFQVAPRGGYTLILLLGTLVTLLASQALAIERTGRSAPLLLYFIIGLCAGLGWWTNQIIAYALLAVTLLFFIALGRKAIALRIVGPGFAGFFIGSLPLWIWNARNDWRSLSFLKAGGASDLSEGLETLFTTRLLAFMGLDDASLLLRVAVLSILSVLVILGAYGLRQRGKERKDAQWLFGLAAGLFLLTGVVIFATSRFSAFNTSRYLVPLVPPLAVLVGLGTAQLHRRFPPVIAWMPLIALILWQSTNLPHRLEVARGLDERAERIEQMSSFLRDRQLDVLYAPFKYHWLNFAVREAFHFSDIQGEKYPPYALAAEQADRIGIVGDYGHVKRFLVETDGTAKKESADLFSVVHDFTPPPSGVEEIPLSNIYDIEDMMGADVTKILTDRNIDTYWTTSLTPEQHETLEITFRQPVELCGIRMLGAGRDPYPDTFKLLVYETNWTQVMPEQALPHYYWSGPRPYWRGERFRMETRFKPRRASVLWIQRPTDGGKNDWQISELQLFSPAAEVESEQDAWPALFAQLAATRINALYCDRWIANKVHVAFKGAITTPLEPSIYGDLGSDRDTPLSFTRHTALLARNESVRACRDVLQRFGIAMNERHIGPWTLFSFDEETWRPAYAELRNVYWLGYACALGGAKELAATKIQQANESIHRDAVDAATVDTLLEAIDLEPRMLTTVPELATWLHRVGRPDEAERIRQAYEQAAVPTTHAAIRFANGIEFLGVRMERTTLAPGDTVDVTYYWRCPEEIQATDWAVFVHVQHEGTTFQNDHVLLSNYRQRDISFQPFAEIFSQQRRMTVPKDALPGRYTVRFGVYSRVTGKRSRPHSEHAIDGDAVTLPLTIDVRPDA